MLQSKIGRNFLIFFLLMNILVVGFFAYAVMKQPHWLPSVLPGAFGPAASPDLSGNMFFLALLLLGNAALFLIFGLGGTWHALWAGLRISPRKLRWLLHDRSGLASDISGVVAEAVQEEEKSELGYLGTARGLLLIGLLLLIVALPAVCIAYGKAAPTGAAMFETARAATANSAVSPDTVLRFTGDQLAGALLLDVPEIFHLRATPVETNSANILFAIFVLLYRTAIGFGVLVWFIATRRIGSLRSAAMEVAFAASEIIAMEPVLQDGHGHSEPVYHEHTHHETLPDSHEHHEPEHHGHDDHAREDHGHSDHGHTDHGPEDHGHDANHGHGHADDAHVEHHPAETSSSEADEVTQDDAESPSDSNHAHDDHGARDHATHDHVEESSDHGAHHAHADHSAHDHKAEETV